MKKAYDSSPQDLVIKSLAAHGLSKRSCLILRGILQKHTSQCGPTKANFRIEIKSGVLQGSILSPTEFNFFVNDIADPNGGVHISPNLKTSNTAFADDLTLFASSLSEQRDQLDHVVTWAETHLMEFNPQKSIAMQILPNPTPDQEEASESHLKIKGAPVPLLKKTKTIGITLEQNGTMSRQSSPNQAISAANKWASVKFRAPSHILIPTYYSFAISSATYGNEVVPFSPNTTKRANQFLRSTLSMPYHSNNTILYEFTGLIRPETVVLKRKIRFAIKSMLSETQPVAEAMNQAINESSGWWIEAKKGAAQLGINLEPLTRSREEWLQNPTHQESLEALKAGCEETKRTLNKAIIAKEAEWHEENLPYISQRNVPGQGCLLFRKATTPGAHLLLKLRWDINDHLRRHDRLRHLDHQCSLCTKNIPESNTHIIFDCKADHLGKEQQERFKQARNVITALFERNGTLTRSEYLQWLTGPKPQTKEGTELTAAAMNGMVKAYKTIHHIRTNAFIRYRQPRVRTAHTIVANPRLTHDRKIQIWTTLINTRSPTQFKAALTAANRTFNTIHMDKKWLKAWGEAAQQASIHQSITPQIYLTFLTNLNEVGPKLCIAGIKERWQHLDITDPNKKHEFKLKVRTIRRVASHIDWANKMPIWHWIHATPLAFAWILERRNNVFMSKHHELVGLSSGSHLTLKANDELRQSIREDIARTLTAYQPKDNNPEESPEITLSIGQDRREWKSMSHTEKMRTLKTITESADWRDPKKHTYHFKTPQAMDQIREEIRLNVIKQFKQDNTAEMTEESAQSWFLSMLNRTMTSQAQT